MKIACDGRRLETHEVNALLAAIGETSIGEAMAAAGYRLKAMRAPRGLRNGNLVLRFVWERRDGNLKVVVRSTITLEAADLV